MDELTTKSRWDDTYKSLEEKRSDKKRVLYRETFLHQLLKEKYINKYVSQKDSVKLLEIGSAPGTFLVSLFQRFKFDVYGLDYSEKGIEINKGIFRENKINPSKAICADFFSNDLQEQFKNYFDVVISRNFIEHFTDVNKVLELHINLLKNNGIILITVPNLKGLNLYLTKLFNKSQISQHNLKIMDKSYMNQTFKSLGVSRLTCEYFGVLNFYLFGLRQTTNHKNMLKVLHGIQWILNKIFPLVFRVKRFESSAFSPYLIFVGIKKTDKKP
jgi:2-polyprenyl-3-methyl-5-hydroxy-6-metoxy-1,4-benzoquinol methylase